ncbi:MAG TPA: LPS export ABC transporter periplasmic protein LptC [Gemmatimonadales bacterium]
MVALLFVGAALSGACNDVQQPPVVARATALDSADQVMFGSRTVLTRDGVRTGELFSDTVLVFDEGTRFELRGVRANFYTETGTLRGTLTSREGTYNTATGVVEARGDAVVVTTDGKRLTSPELRYIASEDLIRSDSSFVLTEPGNRVEGVGFTSDPGLRRIQIFRTTGASGGAVTIPGS